MTSTTKFGREFATIRVRYDPRLKPTYSNMMQVGQMAPPRSHYNKNQFFKVKYKKSKQEYGVHFAIEKKLKEYQNQQIEEPS